MTIETRKLRIIERLLKKTDTDLIDKVESLLNADEKKVSESLKKYSGIWTKEEADEMTEIIADGCESIDHADW